MLITAGSRDQRVAAIAERQRGRVSRRQLLAAGVTANMIHTMLTTGVLHRQLPGVYAVGHATPGELTAETEALLAARARAFISHVTALSLWRLLPPPNAGQPVDVTVLDAQGPRHPKIRAHRTEILDPADTRVHRGLPVTSPARALVDTGGLIDPHQHERALDDALNRHLVRLPQIRDALIRVKHRRSGAHLLDALVHEREHGSGTTRSWAEQRMSSLIRAARLPVPDRNVPLGDYTVDLLWREQRLIVEIDSYQHHLGKANFESDRRRDADLEAQGWTVLRFTASEINHQPYAVIARLAQALVWAQARSARNARPTPA